MTPHQDNGRKDNSSNICDSDSLPRVFPNWRNVDIHATDTDEKSTTICTPFCHPLDPAKASSSSSASASATAASWSDSALESGLDLYERIKSCTDPYISPALTSAIHDLEMAYRLYGPFCMVGSYNGGKDAVVIFHLMRAVHAHYCNEMQQKAASCMIPRPRVIYFQHPDEFPEVLDLLQDTVGLYDLDMLAFKEGVSFGEGLKYLVSRNFAPGTDGLSYYGKNNDETMRLPPPHPLAFILGTRSNDPNAGSQGVYAPSSHYMPPFLRVNPILDWNYGQVWHFLRTFQLPYCKLYDDGFTSLGTVKDTLPCPALKKDNDKDKYWPAYMLRDWDQERAGRISKKKPPQQQQTEDVVETENAEKSVTMSQTSSTVSLGNGNEQGAATQARTRTMSSEINTDELPVNSSIDSSSRPSPRPVSVALIVIGDELLKGMTPDSNIISAARALRANNVTLARVSIISDDSQDILEEIQRVTKEVDVVITSGGVGPTHDDVTIKSVASALGLDMEIHCGMASLLLKKMGNSTEEAKVSSDADQDDLMRRMSAGQVKMATLPSKSELKYLTDNPDEWPVLKCNNIFILPGVPLYFEEKIQALSKFLGSPEEEELGLGLDNDISPTPSQLTRSDTYRLTLSLEEDAIVTALNATVKAHPHVTIGSYPIVDNPNHKTIITLEGRFYNGGYTRSSSRLLDQARVSSGDNNSNEGRSLYFTKQEMDEHLTDALEDLKSRLPDESIISIDQCDDLK